MTTPGPGLPPPGWYADPSGRRGRLRRWTGQAWTQEVRDTPAGPPRWPWVAAGGLLALVLFGSVAIPLAQRADAPPTSTPNTRARGTARPSAPGTFVPTPRNGATARPSAAPPPTISAEPPSVGPRSAEACTSGDPGFRQPQPQGPDRLLGGGFRYALVAPWAERPVPRLPFGSDMVGARPATGSSGDSYVVIGAVRAESVELAAPEVAARTLSDCLSRSDAEGGRAKIDARPVPVTVAGARESAGIIAHYGPPDGAPERTVLVVVSDTGNAGSMPFLVASEESRGRPDEALLEHAGRLEAAR